MHSQHRYAKSKPELLVMVLVSKIVELELVMVQVPKMVELELVILVLKSGSLFDWFWVRFLILKMDIQSCSLLVRILFNS